MNKYKLYLQTAILLVLLAHITCFGQQPNTIENRIFEVGKKYKFYSNVLEEEIELWVRLPRGYKSGNEYYPVVYQLDGYIAFTFRAGLLEELVSKSVPKSILIGILNTDRDRDFTPPSEVEADMEDLPTAGGADNAIRYFHTESHPSCQRINRFHRAIL